ncbi:MAG: hypothetical protein JXR46_11775 [Calditrichaceae bacterium]|nr:hypothetical protein [Calditrichaceae bacterium]MBN2709713.1 hypothetical protein [Calditrichaceae bacterium]RQV92542.1 MAG: hypothetical protein EH224_15210 [Calditrichota bacterium]
MADQNIAEWETRLPGGLPVSPVQAALCLREISRTAMFIKGLAGAIRKEMSKVRKRLSAFYMRAAAFMPCCPGRFQRNHFCFGQMIQNITMAFDS